MDCIINTNKQRVYVECVRVLKPGGNLCVSDIVDMDQLADEILND